MSILHISLTVHARSTFSKSLRSNKESEFLRNLQKIISQKLYQIKNKYIFLLKFNWIIYFHNYSRGFVYYSFIYEW